MGCCFNTNASQLNRLKQQDELCKCEIAILEVGVSLFKLDWLLKIVLESQNGRTGEKFYRRCN